jgi:hypothetical protein
MQDYDYNTQRVDIRLKEYGRSVQDLASHVSKIKDPNERLVKAKSLIKLMKMINPAFKDNQENEQMMWDHLHIISDFGLEVQNSGFEIPSQETLQKKPQKVAYGTGNIRLKHYGGNIEKIIIKLVMEADPDRQLAGIAKVGKMMKKFYADFNSDQLEDDVIAMQIEDLSRGKLKVDRAKVEEGNLFYVSKAELVSDASQNYKKKVNTKPVQKNSGTNNTNNKFKKRK